MTEVPFQSLAPLGAWELLGEHDRAHGERPNRRPMLTVVPAERPAGFEPVRLIG